MGSHKFSPTQTPVTLSGTSVNHKTEFVDESSFPVKGTVTYEGSTIPVEGVQFYIDGVVCSDRQGQHHYHRRAGRVQHLGTRGFA